MVQDIFKNERMLHPVSTTTISQFTPQIFKHRYFWFCSCQRVTVRVKKKRLTVTWAAMTLCLSAISLHLGHWQSLQLQKRLCPFRGDTQPWFLQREHLGILGGFWPLDGDRGPVDSGTCLFCLSLLMTTSNKTTTNLVLTARRRQSG